MSRVVFTLMLAAIVPWVLAQRLSPEELFKRWDKNKDGKLVLAELPQNAKRNFKRADANGDGAITLAEHLQFLKLPRYPHPQQLNAAFVQMSNWRLLLRPQ